VKKMQNATLEVTEAVKKNAQSVRTLLGKTKLCRDQNDKNKVLAWNKGWNQFDKPRGG